MVKTLSPSTASSRPARGVAMGAASGAGKGAEIGVEDGHVPLRVKCQDFRRDFSFGVELNGDQLRRADHVLVGHDQARGIDNETRARADFAPDGYDGFLILLKHCGQVIRLTRRFHKLASPRLERYRCSGPRNRAHRAFQFPSPKRNGGLGNPRPGEWSTDIFRAATETRLCRRNRFLLRVNCRDRLNPRQAEQRGVGQAFDSSPCRPGLLVLLNSRSPLASAGARQTTRRKTATKIIFLIASTSRHT